MDSICAHCGTVGKPKTKTRGSFFIELILWLCFLIPGLIYSIWRLSTTQKVCRTCGKPEMLPVDTPRGQQLLKQFGTQVAPKEPEAWYG